ncbi:MAG: hypothetical protein AAF360_14260 [Pseudomonadota bacterium]
MKTLTLAAAIVAFAGVASACPFSMPSDKSAEAPILKPSDTAGS